MKKFLNLLNLFVFAFLITACSNDNNEVKIPEVKNEQLTLNLVSHDAYLYLGSDPMYKLLTELPEWLSLESITTEKDFKLRFLASGPAEKMRVADLELEQRSGRIKVQIIQKPIQQKGLFILSEAGWGQSKADIAYFDEMTNVLHPKYFSEINGRTLGDVGNDLALYGSKMYVVVSGTNVESKNSYIEVIDPTTCKSVKQIPFIVDKANETYDLPRRIIFESGKGYITGHSGIVARLDTLTLELDAFAKLGEGATYSEGITSYNDKLYICNSGYGKGKTISVVDIKSFKESHQIEVAQNPFNIVTAPNGKIYFQTAMLFETSIPSNLYELDPKTEEVTYSFDIPAGKLAILNEVLYTGDFSWTTYEDTVSMVDLKTKTISKLTFDNEEMYMVYSFDVNPLTNLIFIGSQGDDVATINADGKFVRKLNVKVPYINKVVPFMR